MKKMSNFKRKVKTKAHSKLKDIKPISNKNLGKNIQLSNKSTLTTLKPTKTFVACKNKSNKNINYSITLKEELKKKLSPNQRNIKNKQNIPKSNTNYNKIKSSNIIFTSREIDKDKDKENEKINKKNFKKNLSNFNKKIIPKLNYDIFNKNFLKQTIIIDNEGNNNLNLYFNNNLKNNYKNILDIRNIKFNEKNENNNSFNFNGINETNSLFENSTNYNNSPLHIINKENSINSINSINENTIDINKNEEEKKRLKEYNKIINLLNTNIEQFKKMVNNKNSTINNTKSNNKKILIKNKTNIKSSKMPICTIDNRKSKIMDCKDKYSNLKKNLSQENIKYNKNKNNNNYLFFDINRNENINNNINDNININTNLKNNELQNNNFSFLESSIDNDFYQALINNKFLHNISHSSLDINIDDISNKENIEINNISKINYLTENNDIINTKKINEKESISQWFNNNIFLKSKTFGKLNKEEIETDNHNYFQSYINTLVEKIALFFSINKK